ncbi:MAG TPA: type II secretion system F family protein [Candidatus Saccharibacteria bacterium]|nr:type II secretion system F family protein [Candidatus Saccharibacteria bacterium]
MPNFSFTAVGANNKVVNGNIEGTNRDAVYKHLQEQGVRPLSIKETSPPSKSLSIAKLLTPGKVKSDHIVVFTRELSAMVSAGVPLLRCLNSLAEHTESAQLKKILGSVIKDVEGGAPLADALEKFPDTFSTVYVNMVRAGEAAGILDEILKRLATQQEKSSTMRKKIKSAMTYPTVLVVITVVAFFGLMIFVIPQIGKIISDLGGPDAQLPLITQIMLGISKFVTSYWFILIPLFAAGVFALLRYIQTKDGKRQFHTLIINLPGIKTITRKVAVARFARTFSALIGAGVAVLEALEVTAHAVGNVVYEKVLLDAAEEVKNGATLSSIIEKSPLFPAIVPQMLSVGEETGQTDVVLVKVADFYEEEVDVAIDGLSSIIEPVMIVFMGAMVGLIAASVMSPIANLSQNIR